VEDFATQVRLFNDATRTSRDGIAIFTLNPPIFVRPVRDAIRKEIPIAVVDAGLPPEAGASLFVGNDNTAAGQQLATYALSLIPKNAKGSVVLGLPTPAIPVLQQRIAGVKAVFEKERPNLKVLGPFVTHLDPNANFRAWSDLVRRHRDGVAFIGAGDADLPNLAKIKQSTGGNYLTGAFDLNAAGLSAVKRGVNFASESPEHWLKGYVAIRLLAEAALDEEALPEGWWNPGALLVNRKNVDRIIARQKNQEARIAYFKSVIARQFEEPSERLKPLSEVR
jgi:ABC-type sugar transport system substrate-binding protein